MKNIKNIIFDLGGVVLNIDYHRTIDAFKKLDIPDAGFLYSKASQIKLFDDLEKGLISDEEFFEGIRTLSKSKISDDEIRDAWNALLLDLPEENVELLTELRTEYRIFLLSNTNSIHEKAYRELIMKQYGSFVLEDLFEKMYLSHHIHLRKPDNEIFQYVIKDAGIKSDETFFIDDSPQHIKAAMRSNIASFHLKDKKLTALFDEMKSQF